MKDSIKELFDTKLAELKSIMEAGETVDMYEITGLMDYSGELHEIIDGNIDIYNYDLRVWAVDNYEYCEEAIAEGLTSGGDYHQMIQAGQYVKYQQDANEYIQQLFEELV